MASLLVVYAPTCLSVCKGYIDSLSQELGLSTLDDCGLIVLPACMRCACVHTRNIHTHHPTSLPCLLCLRCTLIVSFTITPY